MSERALRRSRVTPSFSPLSTPGSLAQGGNRFAQLALLHSAILRVDRTDIGIGYEMIKQVDQCCCGPRAVVMGPELEPGFRGTWRR